MVKFPSSLLRPAIAGLLLAGTLPLAAHADSTDRKLSALGYTRGQPVEVLPKEAIAQWDYLSNSSVIIHSDAGNNYLVNLAYTCPELQSTSTIMFNAGTTRGLANEGSLQVGTRSDCPVSEITRLHRDAASSSW